MGKESRPGGLRRGSLPGLEDFAFDSLSGLLEERLQRGEEMSACEEVAGELGGRFMVALRPAVLFPVAEEGAEDKTTNQSRGVC